ncbi:PREDICTED: C3a anaphylatoxin chemotactic receptor [Condylura cristata]|uniref:C3a anaphylatoxin chemotactic receptor n=1 Tax=Condylura cristata TaxID=143302 RepID=UPI000334558D|nr:PREDICTED: C3a anaphylatoxin chemotactic receptor [Condylura cristata]
MEYFSAKTNSTDLLQQFSNQPQIILSMVLLSLTFLLGLPGNGLVLWITGLKMRQTVNTVWFLHLTLADFLCCLSLPFSLAHLALQGHWPYGQFLCKLLPSVIILNMFASVFLLTAISLDRCLLVLQPIWCQNHRSVRTAYAVCGCIWAASLIMCIPVFVYRDVITTDQRSICEYNFDQHSSLDFADYFSNLLENETLVHATVKLPDHPSQAPDDIDAFLDRNFSNYFYGLYMDYNESLSTYGNQMTIPWIAITFTRLVVGFLLPSLLMIVCYSLVIFRIRQGRFAKSWSKTFRVAVVVVVVFLICWTPYHVFGVLTLFAVPGTPFQQVLLSWDSVSLALASANSCFNPFLYALLGKDVRKQAKQSLQGILEAAFSEEVTHSTICTANKVSLDKTYVTTTV